MTFWMVQDSGMDERISRDWMHLMILFLILYLMLVLMFVLMLVLTQPTALAVVLVAQSFTLPFAPPYEATDEDAEAPLAPEASDTGAEIVTEAPLAPEVKEVKESMR